MSKKLLPYQTLLAIVLFAVMVLVCGLTAYSQTGTVSFPSNFIETWKRDNFNNTLTITSNTLTSSSQTFTWILSSVSGNTYKMNNGKTNTTVTIKFDGGNLIISGDSGSGQDNWNGTWKIKPSTKVEGANLTAKLVWVLRNAQSNGDYTIELDKDESLSAQTLVFEGKTNVTLRFVGGETEKIITLNGDGSLFTVASGVTLVLGKGVTLRGHKENNASLVTVNEKASLKMNEGSKIIGNKGGDDGGGVYVDGGTFTMNGGEISGNTANKNGGGVYVFGTFAMNGGTISSNNASYSGGGVRGNNITMIGGTISGNTGGNGGGVYAFGTFTMSGGTISGNNARGSGGGVSMYYGPFTMNGGIISGNTADKNGGGVDMGEGFIGGDKNFTMKGGEISGNSASDGGGVYVGTNTVFMMNDGKISGNTANSGGGMFVNIEWAILIINGGDISSNTAKEGGGVYVYGSLTMNSGNISSNTAKENGGGVFIGKNRGDYGIFDKKSGTIYGYTEGDIKSNVVKNEAGAVQANKGHAVYIDSARFRDSTLLPNDNPDPKKTGLAGGWGY